MRARIFTLALVAMVLLISGCAYHEHGDHGRRVSERHGPGYYPLRHAQLHQYPLQRYHPSHHQSGYYKARPTFKPHPPRRPSPARLHRPHR